MSRIYISQEAMADSEAVPYDIGVPFIVRVYNATVCLIIGTSSGKVHTLAMGYIVTSSR